MDYKMRIEVNTDFSQFKKSIEEMSLAIGAAFNSHLRQTAQMYASLESRQQEFKRLAYMLYTPTIAKLIVDAGHKCHKQYIAIEMMNTGLYTKDEVFRELVKGGVYNPARKLCNISAEKAIKLFNSLDKSKWYQRLWQKIDMF